MKKSRTEETVTVLAEPLAEGLGLELVDVEFVKERDRWFLRIYIDKVDGIGLEDCEKMSRAMDTILDEKDPIPQGYYLEVSSPGVERPLKKPSDFVRFQGERALIRTYAPIDGVRKHEGKITGCENGSVLLESDGRVSVIPLDAISKANLVFEW